MLGIAVVVLALNLFAQVAHQRMLALQALLGVLQQLTQVQQVAQAAFTIGLRQHTLCHMLAVQPLVQHGQHAVLLPQAVPLVKLF